jgi:hypothetical protein
VDAYTGFIVDQGNNTAGRGYGLTLDDVEETLSKRDEEE